MKYLDVDDIKRIATGATMLGAGGGGNPYVGALMAIGAVRENGRVKLYEASEIGDNWLTVPSSMMGAPAVQLEKFPNGIEFQNAFSVLEKKLGKKVQATFPIEAGGVNSMIPIMVAAKTGLPLIDVDSMGRALPELQMSTFSLYGHDASPMVVADEKGNTVLLETIDNTWTEKIARAVSVKMGATAAVASFALTGRELKEAGVWGTLSLCQQIGRIIESLNTYPSTKAALEAILKLTRGFYFMSAKITDIVNVTKDGFNFGTTKLEGIDQFAGKQASISFQNENIIFKMDGRVMITAPDIISMVDLDTLQPMTNEDLKYGKRVRILGLPCNAKWRTQAGIEMVGPRYFNYDVDYQPVEDLYDSYTDSVKK
ncbi:MAG: DUF917 domain-containing protein [Oenococcus sp.]|uniref:DUF917 domain-containing protein n=1 Tax=Oenococcus sp. TaxID=1979414 RepID=UPI0039E9D8C8